MKHNRVSELSGPGQEKLVKELVARVWLAARAEASAAELAERARQGHTEADARRARCWGEGLGAALLDAALSGFAFTIEEVLIEELTARAEAKAAPPAPPGPPVSGEALTELGHTTEVAEERRRAAATPTPASPGPVPGEPARVKASSSDLAAALDGQLRVWVKPGHFARALEPKMEGLGMTRLREGLYVGGYAATLPEAEAVVLMARLRELRIAYEQEEAKRDG